MESSVLKVFTILFVAQTSAVIPPVKKPKVLAVADVRNQLPGIFNNFLNIS
jgi:hypothetical protein